MGNYPLRLWLWCSVQSISYTCQCTVMIAIKWHWARWKFWWCRCGMCNWRAAIELFTNPIKLYSEGYCTWSNSITSVQLHTEWIANIIQIITRQDQTILQWKISPYCQQQMFTVGNSCGSTWQVSFWHITPTTWWPSCNDENKIFSPTTCLELMKRLNSL